MSHIVLQANNRLLQDLNWDYNTDLLPEEAHHIFSGMRRFLSGNAPAFPELSQITSILTHNDKAVRPAEIQLFYAVLLHAGKNPHHLVPL